MDYPSLNQRSVLVTGGTGFIGRHLVRRLVEIGLASVRTAKPSDKKSAAKAAGLAGEMVDYLTDHSVPADIREKRKRRLLTGPSEFREMRTDLPKTKAR